MQAPGKVGRSTLPAQAFHVERYGTRNRDIPASMNYAQTLPRIFFFDKVVLTEITGGFSLANYGFIFT